MLQNSNSKDQRNAKLKSFFEREAGSFPYNLDSAWFGTPQSRGRCKFFATRGRKRWLNILWPGGVELRKASPATAGRLSKDCEV
jgi:hypothetical protein